MARPGRVGRGPHYRDGVGPAHSLMTTEEMRAHSPPCVVVVTGMHTDQAAEETHH